MKLKVTPIERPETLKDIAYRKIKSLMTTGQLDFQTIYSANQFAEVLGVSRTPVREALLQLAAEGFLIFVEGLGFKVKRYSEKEIRDFFETRRMIETYVGEHFAETLPAEDLVQLGENFKLQERFVSRQDASGFLAADEEFHMIPIRRYDNQLLLAIMEKIRTQIWIFGIKGVAHSGRLQAALQEHAAILRALRRKDKRGIVQAILDHLTTSERYILSETESDRP